MICVSVNYFVQRSLSHQLPRPCSICVLNFFCVCMSVCVYVHVYVRVCMYLCLRAPVMVE